MELGYMAKTSKKRRRTAAAGDPAAEAARDAGLVYVSDEQPGIARRRSGRGFTYMGPDGSTVTDRKDLRRIKALAVPPAWTGVWICASPRGHIQATGRDARGRKQYRYHASWREIRDRTKYDRMVDFGEALPRILRRIREDLSLPGLPREKVLATIVRLIDLTYLRVGNPRYAKQNRSFGLTTMQGRHVDVSGSTIRFAFRGKSRKTHTVDVTDQRLARIVRRCQEIPGQQLFQYVDENDEQRPVNSEDVNAYIRECAGEDFTAKDFRTWAGTVLAMQALRGREPAESQREARGTIVAAIETVASALGNTVAVCRACYVHPAVVDAYLDGALARLPRRRARRNGSDPEDRLRADEVTLLSFLKALPDSSRSVEDALRRSVKAARAKRVRAA
ncbi:MAG: DNA topoisomerase IB [Actinomycetota bacterium]